MFEKMEGSFEMWSPAPESTMKVFGVELAKESVGE